MTEVINKKISYKGSANANWKGGRRLHHGYWYIHIPDHPFCDLQGYYPEHRLVMEQHLGRYLTKEEEVHHIVPVKKGGTNDIENLMLFANHAEHIQYDLTKDMSGRFCLLCGSKKTRMGKKNNRPHWVRYEGGFICISCYMIEYKKNRKSH